MAKRFSATRYTSEKHKFNYDKFRWEYVTSPDGTLFSDGRYPTKIKPEDLPEHYIKGNFYGRDGFMKAAGIKQLLYVPNLWINHFLKDDFLLISYDKPIVKVDESKSVMGYEGYDEYVFGHEIISMAKAAEKYSDYDISEIKKQVEEKRQILMQKHPDDYSMRWWILYTPEYLWRDNSTDS